MRKKSLCMAVLMAQMLAVTACGSDNYNGVYSSEDGEVFVDKSQGHNPVVGYSESGEHTYGGDPSVLVDGDTVYLYSGHDMSTDAQVDKAIYNIPEYLCYSSKDLKTWTVEGPVMNFSEQEVKWASDKTTAWASQVVKYKDKYYLYFCCWDKTSRGKQSIGVAVSDSPTGPFEDIGKPLVKGTITEPESNAWNDIDPTIWVDTDSNGVEHRYMAWGNSKYYICELNEDMISVKDINGDGKITCGIEGESADIINHQKWLDSFTEAPWIYRRQDENGHYYGDYYLFYAYGWREKMAYATTDDLMYGEWEFGKVIMEPTTTSNTNHMAVFDFKGKTYFVYHNGSLAAGNGYRRSVCITELHFNENGSVEPMEETAAGLNGTIYTISLKSDGESILSHRNFKNSSNDNAYPYSKVVVGVNQGKEEADGQWVIVKGKADTSNEAYISIQSENKPGLYLTCNEDGAVVLAQDTDNSEDTAKTQTFHTVEGLSGEGVSFESVSQPGQYLTIVDEILCLTDGEDKANATFEIVKVK